MAGVREQPLAARMRPRTLAEFVGQRHLVGTGWRFQKLLDRGHLPSLILWGPAGTGKTTLAYLLADAVGAEIVTSCRRCPPASPTPAR